MIRKGACGTNGDRKTRQSRHRSTGGCVRRQALRKRSRASSASQRAHAAHVKLLRELVAHAHAGGRIAKALRADRDAGRAGLQEVERVPPALDAAHPDDRQPRARGHLRGERQRDRRAPRDPDRPPWPAPSHGSPLRGSIAVARSVLIRDSASAPPSSAATRDRHDVGHVRRELHDQGLRGERPHELHQSGHLAALAADHAAGFDVRDRRRSARGRRPLPGPPPPPRGVANSSCEKPATLTISGPGGVASSGRSRSRKPSRPLLGSPMELISPAGVSHRRGGGLPPRGASVIVLETKAANGKLVPGGRPEGAERRDRVQGPGAVQDGMREAQPRELDLEARGPSWRRRLSLPALLEIGGRDHRAVDAEPPVAVARADHASEAGAEAACHRRLQRELAGTDRSAQIRRTASSIGRRAACVHARRRARARCSSRSVTRP